MLGLVKLSGSLARVKDRLQLLVSKYNEASVQSGKQQYLFLIRNSNMPNHMSWTIKMWHFGKDALTSYSGEKFEIVWEDSLKLFHIYSKEYGNKKINVRNEVQEYPKKPLMDALTAKLKMQVIIVRKLLKLDFDTLIVKAMINLNSQKKEDGYYGPADEGVLVLPVRF